LVVEGVEDGEVLVDYEGSLGGEEAAFDRHGLRLTALKRIILFERTSPLEVVQVLAKRQLQYVLLAGEEAEVT